MTNENHALDQANAQMASIREMVAALECDYDRLEELKEEEHSDDYAELQELLEAAGDCESREDAERGIQEDALSIEVRSDWRTLDSEDDGPTEFRIVLCTGGPHVQIRGELNQYGEPSRAWIEYNDWFQNMRERVNQEGDQEALLAYASCFYFGE